MGRPCGADGACRPGRPRETGDRQRVTVLVSGKQAGHKPSRLGSIGGTRPRWDEAGTVTAKGTPKLLPLSTETRLAHLCRARGERTPGIAGVFPMAPKCHSGPAYNLSVPSSVAHHRLRG
jgi:hypothetical protein